MEHKYTNRLINEKSPYLLQHAHNPVDWFPWREEAFSKAKAEDKPIFLSIGYSTCHWCHVMERESFEDEEVASLLNDYYIAIKVDREERPDVDTIYMSVCQAMTGSGGWPLTIIMTPDKKPFFAGTYYPKHSRYGRPGLMDVLSQLAKLWQTDREKVVKSSDKITATVNQSFFDHRPGEISIDVLDKCYDYYRQRFDPEYGGFGSAPKFPTPHNLSLLLRYWKMSGEGHALAMVETTLESMYQGGIYDHIGFGFARYSTDEKWLAPHFEKMLYDNALLAIAYLETYQATGKPFYARAAREIFTYIMRDMTAPEGGFYSAEDADSEGVEGKFYLWRPDEVEAVLGHERGSEYCQTFDITTRGNFEGKSIPNLIATGPVEGYAEEGQKLFQKRAERIHPFKDDKILTAWNGLMIAAMAFGSRVLSDEKYAQAAEKAVDFIMQKLRREDGRLLARYRDGEASYPAYLDDYAFLIWGLTELYQATLKPCYLALAIELNQDMLKYFWDKDKGGFYQYGWDAEELITRPKEVYDGAMPSGNSVAALNLLRLAALTGDEKLAETAKLQLKAFGETVQSTPPGHSHFLMAVYFNEVPTTELTIIGDLTDQKAQKILSIANRGFRPELILAFKEAGQAGQELEGLIPVLTERKPIGGQTTAYLCQNLTCHPPITDPQVLEEMLNEKKIVLK